MVLIILQRTVISSSRSFQVLDLSLSVLHVYSPSENTVHVYCSTMYGAHIQSSFSQIIILLLKFEIQEFIAQHYFLNTPPQKLHLDNLGSLRI